MILRSIAALALLWGLLPNPYGYYMLLRIFVCATSAYTAYGFSQRNRSGLAWVFGVVAVLYNPVLPIFLNRALWFPIDLASAIAFAWSVRCDRVDRNAVRGVRGYGNEQVD